MSKDTIILTSKDEISNLVGKKLTNKEWLKIEKELNDNQDLWIAVDNAISEILG